MGVSIQGLRFMDLAIWDLRFRGSGICDLGIQGRMIWGLRRGFRIGMKVHGALEALLGQGLEFRV